jgi:L-2-hydroxyglutarate oxidase LhgO
VNASASPDRVDTVVVGAGAVGLAIARRLALGGREVLVLEQEKLIGIHTSSRSNEVAHAGLYYRADSPQAILCVAGHRAIEAYCADRGVPYKAIGKLVVANGEQDLAWLDGVWASATAAGARGIERIDAAAARSLEPDLKCDAAILSALTGIVDTHALMLAYQGDAEANGATVAFQSRLAAARVADGGFVLDVETPEGTSHLACTTLVNAAGLWAVPVARAVAGAPEAAGAAIPHVHFAKGAFFALAGRAPFRHLVVPAQQWIRMGGIYTLDLAMRARFGPEEEWIDAVDYTLDPARDATVYAAVRRYWPALPDGALEPAYTGIRPRLNGPGEPMADWIVQGPSEHGVPGLVHLFGIESPGITSSMPIAEMVAGMIGGQTFAEALMARRAETASSPR